MVSNRIQLFFVCFLVFTAGFAQNEITWKEEIQLAGMFKYIRLCKVNEGVAQGDLIMTYFKNEHSAPFGMRRSQDEGRTWSEETIFMRNDEVFYYVNPSIIQLDDGRLMLSYCKRSKGTDQFIMDEGPCVKFSTDGGYNWGDETFICQGGSYEPKAIQVPHDKNGDGHNDIYVYWSMALIDQSIELSEATRKNAYRGFACGVVASYDNGESWENFRPSDLGGRIVHRNFENDINNSFYGSKGNMPTPFLLPDNRVGVVCEAVGLAKSPWLTVSDPNDWDWENFQEQTWTSYEYFGYNPYSAEDNNVYPTDRSKCWRPTFSDDTFGGAPYACVLPNGRVAFSQNSSKNIRVFVADPYGKNPVLQENPWGDSKTFYSCIIPLNDREVIVAAHDPVYMSKAYLRIGEIDVDTRPPSSVRNIQLEIDGDQYRVFWEHSTDNNVVHRYEIYANDSLVKTVLWENEATIDGLDVNKIYDLSIKAIDYQGNYSGMVTGIGQGINKESLKIFPNPSMNWLDINIPWEHASVEVYNSLGNLVLMIDSMASGRVDISSFNKGVYIFNLRNGKKIIRKRIIKI